MDDCINWGSVRWHWREATRTVKTWPLSALTCPCCTSRDSPIEWKEVNQSKSAVEHSTPPTTNAAESGWKGYFQRTERSNTGRGYPHHMHDHEDGMAFLEVKTVQQTCFEPRMMRSASRCSCRRRDWSWLNWRARCQSWKSGRWQLPVSYPALLPNKAVAHMWLPWLFLSFYLFCFPDDYILFPLLFSQAIDVSLIWSIIQLRISINKEIASRNKFKFIFVRLAGSCLVFQISIRKSRWCLISEARSSALSPKP